MRPIRYLFFLQVNSSGGGDAGRECLLILKEGKREKQGDDGEAALGGCQFGKQRKRAAQGVVEDFTGKYPPPPPPPRKKEKEMGGDEIPTVDPRGAMEKKGKAISEQKKAGPQRSVPWRQRKRRYKNCPRRVSGAGW